MIACGSRSSVRECRDELTRPRVGGDRRKRNVLFGKLRYGFRRGLRGLVRPPLFEHFAVGVDHTAARSYAAARADGPTVDVHAVGKTARPPVRELLLEVAPHVLADEFARRRDQDRKSTRLNSSHGYISY